jgi:hypothetical protein
MGTRQRPQQPRTPQRRPAPRPAQRPAPRPAPQEEELVISPDQARILRETEGMPFQAIAGYDPVADATRLAGMGSRPVPAPTRQPARYVPTPPPPTDEEEEISQSPYRYGEFDDAPAGVRMRARQDGYVDAPPDDYQDEIDEEVELDRQDSGYYDDTPDGAMQRSYAQGGYVDAAYDDDDLPPLPPTAMPVEYSDWLDLGYQEDAYLAQKFRGWMIKVRKEMPFDLLESVERMQDAVAKAREKERLTGVKQSGVRIEYIRSILHGVLYKWNFVDERGHLLPPPPDGISFLTPDLLSATLNRAMAEIRPKNRTSKRSTRP